MSQLSHLDERGEARMVDVSEKTITARTAKARAVVEMEPTTANLIRSQQIPKGDVIATARIAGVMAAKETSRLIPMCHPLQISGVEIEFEFVSERHLHVTALVRATDRTGVEMEALTAATLAALTIYDMCKAVEKGMTIQSVRLLEKTGGKSGDYVFK